MNKSTKVKTVKTGARREYKPPYRNVIKRALPLTRVGERSKDGSGTFHVLILNREDILGGNK
jgi:hypothetical protein